jgi:serine/threonine protein kinase
MELDSYGIYSYFTGDINNISIDNIQKVSIGNSRVKTDKGEFILQTKLGEGTYGKTYATQPDKSGGHQSYAIKIIELRNTTELYNTLGEAIMNIILLEGTEREKDGPYVPRVYEFGVTADLKYAIIRSERMTGTMFDYLHSKSPLANDRIVPETILKLLHISEFLQSRFQFNHRDLKSDNIMYILKNGNPSWRIIDLGAACMTWNGFRLASDGLFQPSRPCVHPGRDMTFLLTELVLDVPLSPKLKHLMQTLTTFPIRGVPCALNSTDCKHADYEKWNNIYNLLNKSNVINPNYSLIKSELTKFLNSSQKLKRRFWNFTFRRPQRHGRRTLRRR